MGGNLTINESEVFEVTNNKIKGNTTINKSKSFKIDNNVLGFSDDESKKLIDIINLLIEDSKTREEQLKTIKNLEISLSKNNDLAIDIAEQIKTKYKSDYKIISEKINTNLKKYGLFTLEMINKEGITMSFKYLLKSLDIDLI